MLENPKDMITKTELETIDGIVVKTEKKSYMVHG